MDHGKSEKKLHKRECLSDLLSPHLVIFVGVVLAATCVALVVLNVRMNRRISAFNDTLEELRREGKKASTVITILLRFLLDRAEPEQRGQFQTKLPVRNQMLKSD